MGARRSEDAETRRRAHPSGQDSPSCGARRRRWFTIGWITRMETMPLWHGAPSRRYYLHLWLDRITKCPTEPAEQHSTHYQATAHNIISTHCLVFLSHSISPSISPSLSLCSGGYCHQRTETFALWLSQGSIGKTCECSSEYGDWLSWYVSNGCVWLRGEGERRVGNGNHTSGVQPFLLLGVSHTFFSCTLSIKSLISCCTKQEYSLVSMDTWTLPWSRRKNTLMGSWSPSTEIASSVETMVCDVSK